MVGATASTNAHVLGSSGSDVSFIGSHKEHYVYSFTLGYGNSGYSDMRTHYTCMYRCTVYTVEFKSMSPLKSMPSFLK